MAADEEDRPIQRDALGVPRADLRDLGLSERDKAEYESLIDIVGAQGIPITKITHACRLDGREECVIRFGKMV